MNFKSIRLYTILERKKNHLNSLGMSKKFPSTDRTGEIHIRKSVLDIVINQ